MTACPADLEIPEGVSKIQLATGSHMMLACWLEVRPSMVETDRNSYTRGLEHQDGLRNENENNPLWKHCTLVHGGAKQDFSMEVMGCFKSCLEE